MTNNFSERVMSRISRKLLTNESIAQNYVLLNVGKAGNDETLVIRDDKAEAWFGKELRIILERVDKINEECSREESIGQSKSLHEKFFCRKSSRETSSKALESPLEPAASRAVISEKETLVNGIGSASVCIQEIIDDFTAIEEWDVKDIELGDDQLLTTEVTVKPDPDETEIFDEPIYGGSTVLRKAHEECRDNHNEVNCSAGRVSHCERKPVYLDESSKPEPACMFEDVVLFKNEKGVGSNEPKLPNSNHHAPTENVVNVRSYDNSQVVSKGTAKKCLESNIYQHCSCTNCNAEFSRKSNLGKHIEAHTINDGFKCTSCNVLFMKKQGVICTEEIPARCANCSMKSNSEHSLNVCAKTLTHSPLICQAKFTGRSGLNSHIGTHTGKKPFGCSHCNAMFSQKEQLIIHIRTHIGGNPFSCPYCNARFSRKQNLINHTRMHTGENPFSCSHCNANFHEKQALNNHIRTHTGEKRFSCSYCDAKFSHVQTLYNHIGTHTGEKPHSYSYRSARFIKSSHLNSRSGTHTGNKPVSCSQCNAQFNRRAHLMCHIRTHIGEKPFNCFQCDKKFTERPNLIRHIRLHERRFSCSHCNAKFVSACRLNRHIRINSRQKLFGCAHCDEKFAAKCSMKKHIREHATK